MMKKILSTLIIVFLVGLAFQAQAETQYCYTHTEEGRKCFSSYEACESSYTVQISSNSSSVTGDCSEPVLTADVTEQPTNYTPLAPLPGIQDDQGYVDLSNYLPNIFNLTIGLAAVLAMIMITIGGIEYMTTTSEGGKSGARNRITYAIGGLILAIAAWLILYTINPALLNFNIVEIERDRIPVKEYSSLSSAPEGWYTNTLTVSPFERQKYGPYVSLEKCESSFTSESDTEWRFFQGCLNEFEESTIRTSLTGAKPGFYSSFDLLTLDQNNPFVFYGPYTSADTCSSVLIDNSQISGKYYHQTLDDNGQPVCDNELLQSAEKKIYNSESEIPNKGIYKRNTNGRVVTYYGPYTTLSECSQAQNVNGTCNEYGQEISKKQYRVGQTRPIGSYKRLGVFIEQGNTYSGRIPSEEQCEQFAAVDSRQALNRADLERQASEATAIFWKAFLWDVLVGFSPPSNSYQITTNGYLVQNVTCQEVTSPEPSTQWYKMNQNGEPGAYLDILPGKKSYQKTIYKGPYATIEECISNQSATPGSIEGTRLIIESRDCIFNEK